jgi:DNA mismatch repair protein MutL
MLRVIEAERDGVRLEAALTPVELARPGARHLFLLVNRRPVVDRGLARAVAFACGEGLPTGYFPRGALSLRLAPDEVDVNAHPQKTEVRFKRAAHVADLVTRMIGRRLGAAPARDAYWEARIGVGGPTVEGHAAAPRDLVREPSVAEPQAAYDKPNPNGLRFIAQLRDRAIVCEAEHEVLVLDRALADALVRYDALREAASGPGLAPASLLFPDRLELASSAEETLERHGDLLRSLGFAWSQLGERSYVIRAAPALLSEARAALILEEALSVLARGDRDPFDAILRALAHRTATPNGKPLDDGAARRIASGIWPDRSAHRACIVGSVPLPRPSAETTDV